MDIYFEETRYLSPHAKPMNKKQTQENQTKPNVGKVRNYQTNWLQNIYNIF